MQPLDSDRAQGSFQDASCSSLPNHFLRVGGIFSWEPWPPSRALPAKNVGGQKVKSRGPQGSKSPRRDKADVCSSVGRSLSPEVAVDSLQLFGQHCPLVVAGCQGTWGLEMERLISLYPPGLHHPGDPCPSTGLI